jgi:predicted phosphoadenosine phosphosulfate sulfurtransferase
MKIYINKNVLEASKERIEKIFNEFPNVVVNFSGGKDSTVLLNLTYEIAKKLNRKFYILFLDEEINYFSTIELVKYYIEKMKDYAIPLWFQVQITYNTTKIGFEFIAWEKGKENIWVREKEPIAIKELKKLEEPLSSSPETFGLLIYEIFGTDKVASLIGLRAEESLKRRWSMFEFGYNKEFYYSSKSNIVKKGMQNYVFYPIYDWTYSDVWKAIYENNWKYNSIYDKLYLLGLKQNDMRVSTFLNSRSFRRSLQILRAVEPDTYDKVVKRVEGLKGVLKLLEEEQFPIRRKYLQLPKAFSSWKEYAIFLLKNLENPDEDTINSLKSVFEELYKRFKKINSIAIKVKGEPLASEEEMWKTFCYTILANDLSGKLSQNWIIDLGARLFRKKNEIMGKGVENA